MHQLKRVMSAIFIMLIAALEVQGCGDDGGDIIGSQPPLPSSGYSRPVWGPNDLIIFGYSPADKDSSGLWLMHSDGTGLRPFLLFRVDGLFDNPDWSPDGQWLALDRDAQIYKIRVTKGDLTQLTFGPPRKYYPSWSPDGRWIAFSINDGPYSEWGVWAVLADGRELKHITYKDTINVKHRESQKISYRGVINAAINPDWSPLRQIAFTGWPEGAQQHMLMLMEDTGEDVRIVFNPARFGYRSGFILNNPQFSPDGTKIAFETYPTETKDSQIWVANVDGAGVRQLTSDGGVDPSWSPDGRRIVYVKNSWRRPTQRGNGKLWITDADGHNQRQLTY